MIKNKKSLILVSSVVVPLFVLFANSCGEEESQSPSELIKIENIKFENKEVVFNGEKHSIEISGDLPEDIDVEYTNNGQIDAGTYEVVAKFTGDETKYDLPEDMKATLVIGKATFDASNLVFKDTIVAYTGNEQSIYVQGDLPEGISVSYTNNGQINVGTYEVVANFVLEKPNYYEIEPLKAKLTIVEAGEMPVLFENQTFSYDGLEKSIFIEGELPEGVNVSYTNNEQTQPGTYEVIASFTSTNPNYKDIPEKKATITIVKDGKYHDVEYYQDGTKIKQEVIKNGELLTELPALPQEKTGYTNMWFYNNTPIQQDMVITSGYVANAYKITYDPQGGKVSSLIQNVLFDSSFELQTPEKEGFTFKGWKYEGQYYNKPDVWTSTSDITLVAEWFDNNAPKYTVNYYFDDELIKTDTVTYGDFYYVYNTSKEKEEHIFVSWTNEEIELFEDEKIEFFFETNINLYANNILDASYFDYKIEGNNVTIKDYLGNQKNLVLTSTLRIDDQYYNISTISDNAFYNCDVIESVYIPSSVSYVGKYTFIDCDNLVEIKVDKENKTYDSRNNSNAIIETSTNKLVASCKETIVTNGISIIGEGAFYGTQKEKIVISSDVYTIEKYAFANSKHLEEVLFEKDSICGFIREYAFQSCKALKTIEIPNRILIVGEGAFQHCDIKEVDFSGSVNEWCSISFYDAEANPISKDAKLFIANKLVENLIIPSQTTKIGSFAFSGYNYLSSVMFEEESQCSTIEKCAFYQCDNLFAAYIPLSVKTIETSAFSGTNMEVILCENNSKPNGWSRYWTLSTIKVVWGISKEENNELFDSYQKTLVSYQTEKIKHINELTTLDEEFKKTIKNNIQQINIYEICSYIKEESLLESVTKLLKEKIDYQVELANIQEKENKARLAYLEEWFGGKFVEINPSTQKGYLTQEQLKEASDKYIEILEKYDWHNGLELSIEELKALYEEEELELKEAMKPYEEIYEFETKKVSSNLKFKQAKEDFIFELEGKIFYKNLSDEVRTALIDLVTALEMEDLTRFETLNDILKEEERVYDKLEALKLVASEENLKSSYIEEVLETLKEEFYLKVATKEYTAIKDEATNFIKTTSPVKFESIKGLTLFEKIEILKSITKEETVKKYDSLEKGIEEIIKKYNLIIEVRTYTNEIITKINSNAARLGVDVANDYSYEIVDLGEFASIPTSKQYSYLLNSAGEKELNDVGLLTYENTTNGYVGKINSILKEVMLLIDAMKLKEEAILTIKAYLADENDSNKNVIEAYIGQVNDLGTASTLYLQIKNSTAELVIQKYKANINQLVEKAKKHSASIKDGYEIDYEHRVALEAKLNQMKKLMGSIDVEIFNHDDDILFSEVTIILDKDGNIIYAAYTDFERPSPYVHFYHDGSYQMESNSQSVIFKFSEDFDPYDETQSVETYEIVLPEGAIIVTGRAKQMITVIENVFNVELDSIVDNSFFEQLIPGFYDTSITMDIMFDSFTDVRWKEIYEEAEDILVKYSALKGTTIDEIVNIVNQYKKAEEEFISKIMNEFKMIDKSNYQTTLKAYKKDFERIMMDKRNTYMDKDTELLEFREVYKDKFAKTETSYDIKLVFEEFEIELAKLIATFE